MIQLTALASASASQGSARACLTAPDGGAVTRPSLANTVLNGHLHYYERMYPQTPDLVRDDANGIRQFIVGTGGASTYTPDTLNVNTVTVAPSRGVLKLTLGAGTYSWEFVWAKGQTYTDSGSGTCH